MAKELATMPGAGVEVGKRGEKSGSPTTISAVFADSATMYRFQFERVFGIGKMNADGSHQSVAAGVSFGGMGRILLRRNVTAEEYAKEADVAGYATLKGHAATLPGYVANVRTIIDMIGRAK